MAEEYDYPEDEFDRLAKERRVLGAHREVKSKRGWRFAALAIIVIVPLIAWIFVRVGAVDSVADKVVTPTVTPSKTKTEAPKPEPTKEKDDTKKDEGDGAVDTDMKIRVLNGSRVNGFAAKEQEILQDAGFTNTVADNYTDSEDPSQSTVFYANESDAATAQKVASTLGISEVKLSPESVSGGQGIVVVLRSDIA